MTNFHNKRSLRCISNVSSSDARSKLLGFLVRMNAGHVDFPPMCQVSKSHIVPRTFKHYVPLDDNEFPEEAMDVEMEDCDESEKSPIWDEAKALLSKRKEWFRGVITGPINPVKSFGNREVHLEGNRTFRYDRDYWDKKSSSPRFDWPRTSTANQILYLIFVHDWGGLTNTLQSVSTISHADALNKAFQYTSYHDASLADSTDFSLLNATAHIVPYNFDGYAATLTNDLNLGMEDFLGPELLEKLSTPRSPSGHAAETGPIQQPSNSPPAAALKPSSYGQHRIINDEPTTTLQRLLSTTSANAGLIQGTEPSSFLATAIIEPDESLHPVQNMIGAGRIILLSGCKWIQNLKCGLSMKSS
eukprot:scaffold47053_cov43-Cyclotella_meneghiniana.AAC.4